VVYHGSFTKDSGYEQANLALAQDPTPTAVLAANNFIAIGALRAIRECGLRVPEDLALVGFDDLPSDLVTFPFLTVAVQPAYQMGCAAAELLLKRLREGSFAQPQEIVFQTEMVIRQSSGGKKTLHQP
jgi:LacI family transcriptional regulator